MIEQVVVPFAGPGEGVGELTWAQQGLWRAMQHTGTSLPLGGTSPLPPGWTVEDMARVLRFALVRHPSLRTRLRLRGDALPEQELAATGEAVLAVVEAGAEDSGEVADRLRRRWEDTVFDYGHEWPIRMGAVTAGGAVSHMVAVYSHLALDLAGLEVLIEDLATMDRLTGTSPVPVAATTGPLELAAQQRGPAAQKRSATALRHWDHLLRQVPARRLPGSSDRRRPRFLEYGYSSVAALHAVRILAERSGLRTGPLLMAACAVALAKVGGADPAVLQVLISNRFRPGLARAVTPLTQSSLCVVPVEDAPLAEVAARSQRAVVVAGKNAYYDPVGLDEVFAAVDRDRAEHVDVDCYFNDRRRVARHDELPVPPVDAVRDGLPRSALRLDRTLERFDHRLFVHVNDVPAALDWTVCADTHHLSPAGAEALLTGMETALVEAALQA